MDAQISRPGQRFRHLLFLIAVTSTAIAGCGTPYAAYFGYIAALPAHTDQVSGQQADRLIVTRSPNWPSQRSLLISGGLSWLFLGPLQDVAYTEPLNKARIVNLTDFSSAALADVPYLSSVIADDRWAVWFDQNEALRVRELDTGAERVVTPSLAADEYYFVAGLTSGMIILDIVNENFEDDVPVYRFDKLDLATNEQTRLFDVTDAIYRVTVAGAHSEWLALQVESAEMTLAAATAVGPPMDLLLINVRTGENRVIDSAISTFGPAVWLGGERLVWYSNSDESGASTFKVHHLSTALTEALIINDDSVPNADRRALVAAGDAGMLLSYSPPGTSPANYFAAVVLSGYLGAVDLPIAYELRRWDGTTIPLGIRQYSVSLLGSDGGGFSVPHALVNQYVVLGDSRSPIWDVCDTNSGEVRRIDPFAGQ